MQRTKKNKLLFFAYISPWIIGFTCFGLFPLVYSLYISFCSYLMVGTPKFIGFQNFIDLFTKERYFYKIFGNTFEYMIATTVLGMGFGLFFSMMLKKAAKLSRLFQTVYYLPSVLPFMAGSMLWISMYARYGILNSILGALGKDPVLFISDKNGVRRCRRMDKIPSRNSSHNKSNDFLSAYDGYNRRLAGLRTYDDARRRGFYDDRYVTDLRIRHDRP